MPRYNTNSHATWWARKELVRGAPCLRQLMSSFSRTGDSHEPKLRLKGSLKHDSSRPTSAPMRRRSLSTDGTMLPRIVRASSKRSDPLHLPFTSSRAVSGPKPMVMRRPLPFKVTSRSTTQLASTNSMAPRVALFALFVAHSLAQDCSSWTIDGQTYANHLDVDFAEGGQLADLGKADDYTVGFTPINTLFTSKNVRVNGGALELIVDPYSGSGNVVGGQVTSNVDDILYASVRTFARSSTQPGICEVFSSSSASLDDLWASADLHAGPTTLRSILRCALAVLAPCMPKTLAASPPPFLRRASKSTRAGGLRIKRSTQEEIGRAHV